MSTIKPPVEASGGLWGAAKDKKYLDMHCQRAAKGPPRNNLSNLTWSFDLWPRCPLVTYPCGYAPRGRLARRQNPGVIFVNVISWRPLRKKLRLCVGRLGTQFASVWWHRLVFLS